MERGFGGEKLHALVVPFPLQGHINPMLYFAHKYVSHGFLVTFVHSEHNHSRIMEAKEKMKLEDANKDKIRLVSISDALAPEGSRSDVPKLFDSLKDRLASSLHRLIQDINETKGHGITCAVFDLSLYYVRHVAKNLDISYALFSTVSVATCVVCQQSSTLISSGIVSPNGTATVDKMINVLPFMPPLSSTKLVWMYGSEDQIKKNLETILDVANEVREELIAGQFARGGGGVSGLARQAALLVCDIRVLWELGDIEREAVPRTGCGAGGNRQTVSVGRRLVTSRICSTSWRSRFLNCTYIVNEWKIGLELIANGDGLVEKGEILNDVEKLVVGEEGVNIKKRATLLRERARESVKPGHSSSINFNLVVETLLSKRL
ncbi:UDP-glycosyltransferase 83A1-like [Cryptomeria japonica]|uniref:UDP-glycosyltransferase 83A1-like n=1 Tax=Cryptomeria japonica TaxID=3369 RepID=UPI0027D9F37B|nr:UDP-glycosyltransferase 83A1-like [Cryptomeria japonica]